MCTGVGGLVTGIKFHLAACDTIYTFSLLITGDDASEETSRLRHGDPRQRSPVAMMPSSIPQSQPLGKEHPPPGLWRTQGSF